MRKIPTLFARDQAIEVRTAPTAAIGAGTASASVLDASGYVVARRMATVSAQITGRVKEVKIEEGMRVEAGQVMATLDPIDADAQRRLYASQAEAARSQIGSVGAQLREAEANAQRLGSLVGQQLVSRAQYDQAIAQRNALRAQLAVAQRNAQVAGDQLRIADQGPGIADEDLPHVFDRFYRSDRARNTPGTGLGLSIVAHTITSHGGQVTARRSAEGGAEFVVRLPGTTSPDGEGGEDTITLPAIKD